MKRSISLLLLTLALCVHAVQLHAQPLEWHPANGPVTSTFYSVIAASDGSIYAGGTDGIFRTTNAGRVWQQRLTYDGNRETRTLFEDKTGALFADGPAYRAVRSRDSGDTWYSMKNLYTSGYDAFHAGFNNRIFISAAGMKYSDDAGTTWQNIPDTTRILWSINSIIPVGDSELVGSSDYSFKAGIYRSTNNGLTWNFERATGTFWITKMVRTRKGTFIGNSFNGIIRFTRETLGDTTQVIKNVAGITCLALDSSGAVLAGTFARGVYRSSDDGLTWASIGPNDKSVRSIAVTRDGDIVAACDYGVWIRKNGSTEWKPMNHGFKDPNFSTVFVTHRGTVLFPSMFNGVYSLDPSKKDGLGGEFQYNDTLHGFSKIIEDRVGTIYAYTPANEIWRSMDDAQTWQRIALMSSSNQTFGLTTDDRLYYACFDTLWISSDKGLTFDRRASHGSEYYLVRPLTDSIYLFMAYNRISRSTDKGATWTQVLFREGPVQSEWVPGEEMLYAAGDTLFFRTSDYGVTWSSDTTKFSFYFLLNVGSGKLFASDWSRGVFASDDSGHTWRKEIAGIEDTSYGTLFYRNGIVYLWTPGGMYYATTSEASVLSRSRLSAANITLNAFPSPASGQQTLRIGSNSDDRVVVTLLDAVGRRIGVLYDGPVHGERDLQTDLSWLPAGSYHYLARSNHGETMLSIILTR